ncbi:MAG: tryptophan-rich sensory protein [bacterium]|nr:tryptophan-rich sensory protein [bacterium]
MNIPNWAKLLIAVCGSLLAGGIGSAFTAAAIPTWYETIIKPDFSPPNWIFGPVWTTLYIMMGVAVFLVWSSPATDASARKNRSLALSLYCLQLILNTLWSIQE